MKYAPFLFSYNSSVGDSLGVTRFSGNLNMLVRKLVSDITEFEESRYMTKGNYLFFTAGVEREMKLPGRMDLFLKVDGQIADQPLVTHEQYIAGGMTNVRGYKESEVMGDDALHGTAELAAPDLAPLVGLASKAGIRPYLFYDYAWLETLRPLASQRATNCIQGAGAGIRGVAFKNWQYELDLAFPLVSTSQTDKYSGQWYFRVGFRF